MALGKHGWKGLAIVCLLYSFTAGLLLPLSPAIYSLSDIALNPAQPKPIYVTGYHTAFKPGAAVWFSFSGPQGKLYHIKADSVQVLSADSLVIFPVLPAGTPDVVADVWVENGDGLHLGMASALHLEQAQGGDLPPSFTPPKSDVKPALNLPFRYILEESIRNLFFHVPMWFTMIILLLTGVIYSLLFLRTNEVKYDLYAAQFNRVALFFGVLGLLTGSLWARNTWGDWWTNDAKLNGTAVGLLIYCAWFVLRNGIEEPVKRAKISSVYSVFAFPIFIVLIFVLPRINDSLHPGNGGNPGFNKYDLDANMRLIFYPAVLGWILTGVWISQLLCRITRWQLQHENND